MANDSQTSAPVDISLTIEPYCQFSAPMQDGDAGTLSFGQHSQLQQVIRVAGSAGQGAIAFQCTAGTTLRVVMGAGLYGASTNDRQMRGPSGAQIQYQLYSDAAYSQVWDDITGVTLTASGELQSLPVFGVIMPQFTPGSGAYSDEVSFTIHF